MSQASSLSQIAASQFNSRKYNFMIDTDIGDDIDDTLAIDVKHEQAREWIMQRLLNYTT
jgi:hypothetical protein